MGICWAPSRCQAGCQTHLLKGRWDPNLFLTGPSGFIFTLK